MAAKRVVIVSGSLLALLLFALFGLMFTVNALLLPVDANASDQTVLVEIPSGANTAQIASILKEAGIIHNSLLFRFYTRWYGLDERFIAGRYQLNPAMSLEGVAALIVSGEVYRETNWFTIPEGFTAEQIAARLSEQGLVDEALFLELASRPSATIAAGFAFLQEIDSDQVKYLLEGYLFPDTYEIPAGATEEEIVFLMLKQMDTVFTDQYKQRAQELGMSMHQVLTLASIIEREGRVEQERPLIAGVFHNRLAMNHPLESCATIQYILGEVKPVLLYEDLRIPSPYNTYQNPGLPPGPIAAPGAASIHAALYPEETDYFFFVYKEDSSGEHYFSRTLSEHEAYARRARQNRANGGSGS